MSLEGWTPVINEYLSLAEVVDLAFDYRGNTTIIKSDGTEIVGYLFNRNRELPEPYLQYFDLAGNGPFKLLYSEIQNIKFTGKDPAAGNSWQAWLERKEKEKAEKGVHPQRSQDASR
jgi:hypothetical protein